MEELTSHPHS